MLKNITVMERTIFTRYMQLLGSKGGIVFEIIGDKVGLASCLYNKMKNNPGCSKIFRSQ